MFKKKIFHKNIFYSQPKKKKKKKKKEKRNLCILGLNQVMSKLLTIRKCFLSN